MDLEDTMASLRLNDNLQKLPVDLKSESETLEEKCVRRSTRTKTLRNINYKEKRRVFTKPMKIKEELVKDSSNYYFNKKIKRLSPELETIYEDTNEQSEQTPFKQVTKQKSAFKDKVKKEKMKVKSNSAQQRLANRQKIPLKYLLEKLYEIKE